MFVSKSIAVFIFAINKSVCTVDVYHDFGWQSIGDTASDTFLGKYGRCLLQYLYCDINLPGYLYGPT